MFIIIRDVRVKDIMLLNCKEWAIYIKKNKTISLSFVGLY